MRRVLRVARVLAAFAMAGTLLAAAPAATTPAGGDQSGVLRATLGNGLRVIIVRDTLAPVVTTMMNYEVGSDEQSLPGLAHAQEHMMFRGSKSLSASQFADVTAITGGSFDADTQDKVTQFFYVVPSQYLDIALHLEAARATGLQDSQAQWNQERRAIEQEVTQDESDAGYRLYEKLQKHVLAGTPYAKNTLGTLESFGKEINAPQLQAFYRTWYHPNNAVFVITGDVDLQATLAKVERLFGAIAPATLPARQSVHVQAAEPATFTDTSDQPYTLALIGFRMPGYDSPDFAASLVLQDVLNSQRGDLYGVVAAGKAFYAGFQAQPFERAGMGTAIVAVPPATKPLDAAALATDVIAAYRKRGVPEDLVEAAKQREIAAAEYAKNSIEGLASAWSQAVAVEGRTSPDDDVTAISKVTVGDVDRVLRTYLDPSSASIAYAVPKNTGKVGVGAKGKAKENNTVIPTEHPPLPSWAKNVLAHLHVPAHATKPAVTKLSNGITLVVQRETITPTVVVEGLIRNDPGLEESPGKEGVAGVTSALLPYGTSSYDRLQYQAELDKISADVDTGTSFSLRVLAKHFDRGMQLLADDELQPRLAPVDFSIVKRQQYEAAVADAKAPDFLARVALARALYPAGDPSRRHATPASVKNLTLDDVKAWYQTAYRPDLATIVVVGDVTPQQAQASVEKWFGAWRAQGPAPNVEPSPVPANEPTAIEIPDTGRIQDQVTLAETLRLRRTDRDYAPLRVADTILGGGFYASKLYHDLRETKGYVYYVGTQLGVGKTRSSFSVTYGAMPENVGKAQALIVRDLNEMQRRALPGERLLRAKALMLAEVPIREDSYQGVADQLLGYASEGLPLDQDVTDARAALAVTPQQLRAAMAKWIRPDGFVRVVQGPPPM